MLVSTGKIDSVKTSDQKLACVANRFDTYSDGYSIYHTALSVPTASTDKATYQITYAARSYMTVKYSDGGTKSFYSDFGPNNVRSMRDVATKLVKKGQNIDIVKTIMEVFVNDPMPDYDWSTPVLVSYCTDGSLYDGPFNSTVGWFAAGMGYIVRTEAGKIIAIDGGNTTDANQFYTLLKEYCLTEKVVVDYWILTHAHGDHVNCLISMFNNDDIRQNLEIKNMVYHFPKDFKDGAKNRELVDNIANYYNANVITPVNGLKLNVGGANIQFYYVEQNYASYSSANQISLIFSIEQNKKIMFTGDSFENGLKAVTNEYGAALKSDILQMPHHFLCDTGYKPFYEAVDASEVILPTCIAGYNAMYNDASYKNSAKHLANDFAAKNADKVYKSFEGTTVIEI